MEEEKRNEFKVLAGKLKERVQLEKLDTDGRIILKVILKYYDQMLWTGLNWHWIGTRCMLL
jgi:hypothetical protein